MSLNKATTQPRNSNFYWCAEALHFLQLASDLVQHWLANNPGASICTQEGVRAFKAIANFQDYHGLPEFRNVRN